MTSRTINDLESEFKNSGYGTFKAYVAMVTAKKIGEIQSRYNELLNSKEVDLILNKGLEVSINLAREKYELVKEKVGLSD